MKIRGTLEKLSSRRACAVFFFWGGGGEFYSCGGMIHDVVFEIN